MKKQKKDVVVNININVQEKKPDVITQVAVVMDKSGSMGSIQQATIDGFNEYIDTLRSKGDNYEVSLTCFDTEITRPFVRVPIKKVQKLTREDYIPGGMTALLEGVGVTIETLQKKVEKNTPVLVVVITDGGENASDMKWRGDRLPKLIKEREKAGWTFVFIGANQDSWATAQTFGLTSMDNVVNFNATEKGAKALFRGLGNETIAYTASSLDAIRSGAQGEQLVNTSFFSASTKQSIEGSK
jgi:von Willebrand factor type A domain